MSRNRQREVISLGIWLMGAVALYLLLQLHPSNKIAEQVYEYTIYVIAGFYFLALHPIGNAVYHAMPTETIKHGAYEIEIVYRAPDWDVRVYRIQKSFLHPEPKKTRFIGNDHDRVVNQAKESLDNLMDEAMASAIAADTHR
jgi:hypothetical protein